MVRSFLVGCAAALLAASGAQASTLIATVRDVGDLPTVGNNGHVIGHDVGYSALHNGRSYFVFGDTYIDKTPYNDQIDYRCQLNVSLVCTTDADCGSYGPCQFTDSFLRNTIEGSTTDTSAATVPTLTYKVNGTSTAKQLLTNDALTECFVWPSGIASANNSLYVYYQLYRYFGTASPCTSRDANNNPVPLTFQGTGLARLDTSNPSEPVATRLGTYFASNEPYFGAPLVASVATGCGVVTYVYLFGIVGPDIYLLRAPAQQIEDIGQYQYWGNASGTPSWVTSFYDATPIVHDPNGNIQNNFSVAYNAYMDRFLAIYSCGTYPEGICAAWTTTSGSVPTALNGTWSAGHRLYNCPGVGFADCYQAFQHAQFAAGSPAGKKIYVTSAINHTSTYHVDLRELTLTWFP